MEKDLNRSSRREHYRHALLLLIAVSLAYWPLVTGSFALKNDSLVYFLPYRYHVSEAIRQGHFPWWNPYLYTGLPLHSDIQSGVWNPLVMIISLFTTYNMTVLQAELLIYLWLAALGMYALTRALGSSSKVSLLSGIIYACCGFMTDSAGIMPWITAAAYLPFVFLYFYRLYISPSLAASARLALALCLLLTAGYPSFFIFCLYLLLLLTAVLCINRWRRKNIWPFSRHLGYSALLLLLISSPALLSWIDFFPYYDRGSGATLEGALSNSFPPFSSISYLFPAAVAREHPLIRTDLSARNASIGIFLFLFWIVALLSGRITPRNKLLLSCLLFCFLFSLGDATPLRAWCHRFLPLMDTFRHPASMRIFTTIAMLLIAAPALDQLWQRSSGILKKTKWVSFSLILLFVMLLAYFIPGSQLSALPWRQPGKALLDALSFNDMILLQGSLQAACLLLFVYLLAKQKFALMGWLIAVNALLLCWMELPFTVVSRSSAKDINSFIGSFPRGYPLPDLAAPVGTDVYAGQAEGLPYGYSNFYNKKITVQDHIVSPTVSSAYFRFLEDKELRTSLKARPFLYWQGQELWQDTAASSLISPTQGITLEKFYSNGFTIRTQRSVTDSLHIFQQYHHGWQVRIDGEKARLSRSVITFMSVQVPAGRHTVQLTYRPADRIIVAMYIAGGVLMLVLAYLSIIFFQKKPAHEASL